MSGAFEPVEDVGAAGVVDLVKGVSVRLLDCHGVTAETDGRMFRDRASLIPGDTQQFNCNRE